jgi:hypothetical protein
VKNIFKSVLVLTASLTSVVVASGMAPAQAALINFDFSSTSSSGVRGRITFDNSVTTPGQVPGKPTVAEYLGAIQSYRITNGTHSFSGAGIFSSNQINAYDNIIDINDPFNRTWAGDGLEFLIGDGSNFLFLRFLYPDTTVLNSLALSDISLQNAIASQAPQLPFPPTGALFTLLQVIDSGGFAIQDGTFFGSDFATSTSPAAPIPEPTSSLSLLALGAASALKYKLKQKSAKKQTI